MRWENFVRSFRDLKEMGKTLKGRTVKCPLFQEERGTGLELGGRSLPLIGGQTLGGTERQNLFRARGSEEARLAMEVEDERQVDSLMK